MVLFYFQQSYNVKIVGFPIYSDEGEMVMR